MRPSNSSKFRLVLLALLLAGGMYLTTSSSSFGQAAGGAAAADKPADAPNKLMLILQLVGHDIDFVTVTVAVLSVVAVTLIVQAFLKNRAATFMPEETTNQIREMIGQRKFKELIEFTETDPSFISRALNPALKRAPSFSSMKEAMETAIGEQTAEQFRKIEYLNIIGNLGPLLGLLGTVLGMIQAFSAMQAAGGNANPAELAGGISTALTHTFLGLFLGRAMPGGLRRAAHDRGPVDGPRRADRRGVTPDDQAAGEGPRPGRRRARPGRRRPAAGRPQARGPAPAGVVSM
jgi:biopolymer transport protein ExbB